MYESASVIALNESKRTTGVCKQMTTRAPETLRTWARGMYVSAAPHSCSASMPSPAAGASMGKERLTVWVRFGVVAQAACRVVQC